MLFVFRGIRTRKGDAGGVRGGSFLIGEVRGRSEYRGVVVVVWLFCKCRRLASRMSLAVRCRGVQWVADAV